MRAQTTLEFLILLSAAASLSVFAIGVYSNITTAQKPFYKLLEQGPASNSISNVPIRPGNDSGIYASIADVIYVNKSNSLEVIVTSSSPTYFAEVHVTGGANAAVIPSGYRNVSADGLSVLTFSVVPKTGGAITLNATADFSNSNGSASISAYAETYAVQSGTNGTMQQGPEFAASLSRRNESILYGIGSGISTYTASMWSHCSELDWGYSQLPLNAQCGDADWYFWLFDPNCYYNHGIYYVTYCVKLNPTNTSVGIIRNAQSYGYNVSLMLYNSTERLAASLSDLKNTSPLSEENGRTRGNAAIGSVSGIGPQPYASYVVLNTSGATRAINISYYNTYLQYLNGLESFMNYYNHTVADPGIAAQDISYLNSETANFMAAPPASQQQCRIAVHANKSYYSCNPISGLYYTINASIDPHANLDQSIAVQGSTVNVR